MSARTSSNGQRSKRVTPIEAIVVAELIPWLKDKCEHELNELVQLRLDDAQVRADFIRWVEDALNDGMKTPHWLRPLQSGDVAEALKAGLAWDCLQVVVLAYLPGPQYFQGAYIHSQLRDDDTLMKLKGSFYVPHLSGAVSWMSTYLLSYRPADSYVMLADAQLDLRGRVAVPDRQLGNRSVLGFPVSVVKDNRDLASISGFFFFSHPVPGVFPPPADAAAEGRPIKPSVKSVKKSIKTPQTPEDVSKVLSEAFTDVRTRYESALASAIESYISRNYGEYVLNTSRTIREPKRTPLLTLSDNDPTGFLATILFESSPEGALSAECDVNENVLLNISARYLRVANLYADRWAPKFVRHMKVLGQLIESSNLHCRLPMIWFFRGGTQLTRPFYPDDLVRDVSFDQLGVLDELPANSHRKDVGGIVEQIIDLFAPPIDPSRQADLVVPLCSDRGGATLCHGFFRVNSVFDIPDPEKREAAFRNLYHSLAVVREEINSAVSSLILELEEERYSSPSTTEAEDASDPDSRVFREIRHIKLWTDTFYLIINWLARQMHLVTMRLTNAKEDLTVAAEAWGPAIEQEERLITFALETLNRDELTRAFERCRKMWDGLPKRLPVTFAGPPPEIIFLSFWPRMRAPVFASILPGSPDQTASAEEEFTELFNSDPGLLRMLMLLIPVSWKESSITLGRDANLYRRRIIYGVPTNPYISELTLERIPGDVLTLDLKWTDKIPALPARRHHIRVLWDQGDQPGHTRNLAPHAISFVPRKVARRIGENILADLDLKLTPEALDELQDTLFNPKEYFDLQRFISSSKPDMLQQQLNRLKGALLYGSTADSVWRILKVKDRPLAFIAALCNPDVNRPAVLAFRDLALASAQAFYVAREYDAKREAYDDYRRTEYSVAHGYKGPISRLSLAIGKAQTFVTGNPDQWAVYKEMQALRDMASSAELLAESAMFYAYRTTDSVTLQPWRDIREQIESVIRALDWVRDPEISFERGDIDDEVRVKSSPYLWRHLLSKLIDNAIDHGSADPQGSSPFKVFLRPELAGRKLILTIRNFVQTDSLDEAVKRVGDSLLLGKMVAPKEEEAAEKPKRTHGFGLFEARTCCQRLNIDVNVGKDELTSQLIISLAMTVERAE